ncbi:MAG TPA: sulfite exporter TauE/SafE family protein [Acidimicrobiales bacterium]|nr:sulfite exporter TauE/SafE family protein [Acidimicrobiales bacterium]
MSPLEALAIAGVGLVAGTVNTVVGSGSLVTFPTLLAFGYPAVLANVTNTVGLVPGSASGVVAYRSELSGQARRLLVLGIASTLGGVTGAVLLLALPHHVFRAVVPVLILVACALVVAQPALARRLAGREHRPHGGAGLFATVYVSGVYGGYFGAAQGVILMALLGVFLVDDLQRLNAAKNVLALLVNAVAALFFVAATHVAWSAAGFLAVGAVVGGQIGGVVGRRLPPAVLRAVIVAVGVTAAVVLLA